LRSWRAGSFVDGRDLERRLVAFQLGSDVVDVVDACSRARATEVVPGLVEL
jgi:hypothetical protein